MKGNDTGPKGTLPMQGFSKVEVAAFWSSSVLPILAAVVGWLVKGTPGAVVAGFGALLGSMFIVV